MLVKNFFKGGGVPLEQNYKSEIPYLINKAVLSKEQMNQVEKFAQEYYNKPDDYIYNEIRRLKSQVSPTVVNQYVNNLDHLSQMQGFLTDDIKYRINKCKGILEAPARNPQRCPGNPRRPINPRKPVNPINPEKPGNPVNPAKPVNPINPEKPINPINPEKPVNPINPINPIKPKDVQSLGGGAALLLWFLLLVAIWRKPFYRRPYRRPVY